MTPRARLLCGQINQSNRRAYNVRMHEFIARSLIQQFGSETSENKLLYEASFYSVC